MQRQAVQQTRLSRVNRKGKRLRLTRSILQRRQRHCWNGDTTTGSQREYRSDIILKSSELGLPQPLTRRRVCPPPVLGGRGTLAGERRVGRVPIPTRGHTLWYSLYIRTLCSVLSFCYYISDKYAQCINIPIDNLWRVMIELSGADLGEPVDPPQPVEQPAPKAVHPPAGNSVLTAVSLQCFWDEYEQPAPKAVYPPAGNSVLTAVSLQCFWDEYEQPAPKAVHPPAGNSVLTAVSLQCSWYEYEQPVPKAVHTPAV